MIRPVVLCLMSLGAVIARAQSIRGTVIDERSKAPVPGVLVTMIDASGVDAASGVRTDSTGGFVLHAARAGTWRVRTMRIGYAPVASPPVELAVGALAVVRLRLTTIAQQLVPVQVVERRQWSAGELMSTTGFDLRQQRGQGAFLGGDRLAVMGLDGVREVLGFYFQPRLFVYADPVLGDVLRMREGSRLCAPEVFLDGRLLATAPEPSALIEGTPPQSLLDSVRAQSRSEADQSRLGFSQVVALNTLTGLTARALHGIEVYRANEVPPSSLGAWFGMTKTSIQSCGTVAVWTKAGAMSVVSNLRPNAITTKPLQVIVGTLVDFDTGRPISGQRVSLLTEAREVIGQPVTTDESGEFVIRTGRGGALRLRAGDSTYRPSTTPALTIASDELVIVRLYVSTREPVLAPLGLSSRVLPHTIGVTSRSGFTYRRERRQGGTFFRAGDIERLRARTMADVVREVSGVEALGDSIGMRTVGARAICTPGYYLDGLPLAGAAPAFAIPMERILGVEVYSRVADVPGVFPEVKSCGVIAIWTKP